MMKKYFKSKAVLYFFTLFTLLVGAQVTMRSVHASQKAEVPPVMYQFLSEILTLEPYLYSQEQFIDDKNKDLISQKLHEFSKISEQLKTHQRLKTPGFRIPATVFIKQLKDVSENYDSDHRSFAWRSLRSTLHSCSQCHTQVASQKVPAWNFEPDALPKDPMELGSFWYMIRSYDKSDEQFTKVVDNFGDKNPDQFQLRAALKYLLSIDLRIKQSPELALKRLESIKNQNKFPQYLQKEMIEWKNELKVLKMLPPINISSALTSTVETYSESILRAVYPIALEGRSKFVAMEYASGLLYQFVNSRPIEATQRMFFWLGVSNNEFDRFEITPYGSSYLKECIENYPPSSISQECYRELEDSWTFGFSGSAGTFLPEQYKQELKRLKKQVESAPYSY